MRQTAFAFLALVLSLGSGAAFGAIDQKPSAFVLCKNQRNVRTIRILPEEKDTCSVTVSKGGTEEVIGSKRSIETCRTMLRSVQNTLEDEKWSCRSVRSAQVTTSTEYGQQ